MSMTESIKKLSIEEIDETEVFQCGMIYNAQGELTKLYVRDSGELTTLYYSNDPYGLCAIGRFPGIHPVCLTGTDDEAELEKYMSGTRYAEANVGIISGQDAYYGIKSLEPLEVYKMSLKTESESIFTPVQIDCSGCDQYDMEPDDPDYESVMSMM